MRSNAAHRHAPIRRTSIPRPRKQFVDVGMLYIQGFHMGSDSHYPEEAPVHRVKVDRFWLQQSGSGCSSFFACRLTAAMSRP